MLSLGAHQYPIYRVICICCCFVAKMCLTLCDPMDRNGQASLSMGFPRQKYWSGLPFPSPGHFPDPGIRPRSPALQVDPSPLSSQGSPYICIPWCLCSKESTCQCQRHRFDPWVWQIPWRRKWHPTPVFLSKKTHGQRSLKGYNP